MNSSRQRYPLLKSRLDMDIFQAAHWTSVDTSGPLAPHGFTCIDLFSGAGGLSLGARRAGFTKLFSIDSDPDASTTIRNNSPEGVHLEAPIEQIDPSRINGISPYRPNVLFASPPCQGFSVAGARNPADHRNRLFQYCVNFAEILQPDFVVIENVPGILTIDRGSFARDITAAFHKVGYPNMTARILEAAAYGAPQMRPRAIFIANRHGLPNPYPAERLPPHRYMTIQAAIEDLAQAPRFSVPNHDWTQHSPEYENRIAAVQPGQSLYSSYQDAFKRQRPDQPAMTVKENHGGCHIHYRLNRVLSARELARLQTFPDDYVFSGTTKRAYWQIGNAVPVLMAQHIAHALIPALQLLHATAPGKTPDLNVTVPLLNPTTETPP